MLLKSLQLSFRNLRNLSHLLNSETYLIIHSRNYARFTNRKLSEIINEDELFDIEENVSAQLPEEVKKSKLKKFKAEEVQLEYELEDEPAIEASPIEEKKPKKTLSTKLYENEKMMASIMMSVQTKKKRLKNNLICLESKRLIQEAIKAGLILQTLIFSRPEDILDIPYTETDTQLFKVPYRTIQTWSTLTTSPGIMGIFEKPKSIEIIKSTLPLTLICDNIRDPQNMGSVLRAAAGVGCEKVILTKGCVDFWETKVVRSGAGAHFRVPIHEIKNWNDIDALINADAVIFLADNNIRYNKSAKETQHTEEVTKKRLENFDQSKKWNVIKRLNNFNIIPYFDADYTQNEVVLIVGGETEGLSVESLNFLEARKGVRVNIPLENNMDSLNAGMALGIVAFEIKKQFLKKWEQMK